MSPSIEHQDLNSHREYVIAHQFAEEYIQKCHPSLEPVRDYIPKINHLDQLWQLVEENGPIHWVFFSITLTETIQTDDIHNPPENRNSLEQILEEMLLSDHPPNQTLSLEISEALEQEHLTYYCLHISLNPDDLSLISIRQTEKNLTPPQVSELQPTLTPETQSIPKETPPEALEASKPSSPVPPALSLSQQARNLSKQLSPPGLPIGHKQNSSLATTFEIKTIKDRYGRNSDLILEYSPSISEAELVEQLSRLGHYESLNYLAHQHIFVQEKMQAWFKQNKQPSPGAIAPHLHQSIINLRNTLNQRIETLLAHQLQNRSSADLKAELNDLQTQQQHQQTLLNQIDPNPFLGYLDTRFLHQDEIRLAHLPFTHPNQPINSLAQHLKNRDEKLILTLIDSCQSDKYKTYLKRKQNSDELNLFVGYAITQKLYPNRPVFIGPAPKAVFPRLECLWGNVDEPTMQPNPITQIWCIYPMIRTDPALWLMIAATTDTQPLSTIALENGKIVQEGTYEYLVRSLFLMAQSADEYTHALAGLVSEAGEQKRVKYLHIHQTLNPQTDEPRDIIQMQFQLRNNSKTRR